MHPRALSTLYCTHFTNAIYLYIYMCMYVRCTYIPTMKHHQTTAKKHTNTGTNSFASKSIYPLPIPYLTAQAKKMPNK